MKSLLTSGGAFGLGGSSATELEPVLTIGSSIVGVSELDPGIVRGADILEELPERRYFEDRWWASVNTSFHAEVTREGSYAIMLLCMVSVRTGFPFPAVANICDPLPAADGVSNCLPAVAPFPSVGKKCSYPHGSKM